MVTQDQTQAQVDSSEQKPATAENLKPESTEQINEESFFDPNSVPEELKPAYKQMQAAFTKKTQEAAQQRKEAEAFRQKAEAYAKYERYIPLLEEMAAGNKQSVESPQMQALGQRLKDAGYSDEAVEMMKISAEFLLNQTKQEQVQAQQSEFISRKIEEAGKVDDRLNDQSLTYDIDGETVTFGQIVENLVGADPNWTKDPVLATKKAIKVVDAMIAKAKTDGKQELSAKAKTKAGQFPQVSSSPQEGVDNSQPMSFQEAAAKAKADLGV